MYHSLLSGVDISSKAFSSDVLGPQSDGSAPGDRWLLIAGDRSPVGGIGLAQECLTALVFGGEGLLEGSEQLLPFLFEVGAFYWTASAPDIVSPGREEQGSFSL